MRVYSVCTLCERSMYLLFGLRSLISTLRKGKKAVPQNGQVLLRLESFAIHPAMISSSYTRQSQVLQSEQLDISTYNRKEQDTEELRTECNTRDRDARTFSM